MSDQIGTFRGLPVSENRLKRDQDDFSRLAEWPVTLECQDNEYWICGPELACLRLYHLYRGGRASYSANLKSWYFTLPEKALAWRLEIGDDEQELFLYLCESRDAALQIDFGWMRADYKSQGWLDELPDELSEKDIRNWLSGKTRAWVRIEMLAGELVNTVESIKQAYASDADLKVISSEEL